jgi:hypothetical protein
MRLLLFAVGAILGTALDHLHVASGTTSYAQPLFWQAAWWTPLIFGFAAVGFADLNTRLRALVHAPPRPSPPALLAADLAVFAVAYWASAYLPLPNVALLAIFAAAFAARIFALRDPWHRALHGVACALLGVTAEWALSGLGLFTHHRADLLRVPLWLPGLYLLSSPLLAGLDDALFQIVANANNAAGAPVAPPDKGGTT